MNAKITAILLAAGESKRMGEANKLILEVQGKPMIRRTLDQLQQSSVAEIIVVTSEENYARLDEEVRENFHIVFNPDYKRGMTTSIQRGVAAASPDADGYMICMSDQPFMQAEEYDLLIGRFSEALQSDPACIVLPFFRGQKGNPVIFSHQYKEAILAHQEMEGCKAIVQSNKQHVVKQEMPSDTILRDIDTPEDYKGIS
jgi:molybdenum cofactor cytidylyltransferase